MKKKTDNQNLDLDVPIILAGAYDFANNFDNAMKKEKRRILKILLIIIGPFILFGVGALIFQQITLLFIGLGLLTITAIISEFIETSNSLKDMTPKTDLSQYNPSPDDSVDVVLTRDINIHPSNFYTDEFKEAAKEYNLRHPNIKNTTPKLRLVGGKEELQLNKNESINQINNGINSLYIIYKLPPFKIESEIWELFLDHLYTFLENKGMPLEFYDLVFTFIKFCLSKVLYNNRNTIKISDFVDNLHFLMNNKINENEIKILQEDIRESIKNKKVINLKTYLLKVQK